MLVTRLGILPHRAHALHGFAPDYTLRPPKSTRADRRIELSQVKIRGAAADTGRCSFVFQDNSSAGLI